MRSYALVLAAAGLLGACASRPPSLDALAGWNGSATIDDSGSTIFADYEAWPTDAVPLAFACVTAPADVFDGSTFTPARSPDCAPFTATVNGERLHIAIDRERLPPAFDGVEWWSVVLAMDVPEGQWSVVTGMPSRVPRLPGIRTPAP
jgi:hypothetical protein